jgi:hypothetical protein
MLQPDAILKLSIIAVSNLLVFIRKAQKWQQQGFL